MNSTPPCSDRGNRGSRRAALALGTAAPALAQTVRITSTPNNGTHYVAGEAITTRLDLPAHLPSGNTSTSQMKLDIGGRERRAASTTPYSFALPWAYLCAPVPLHSMRQGSRALCMAS